MAPSSSRRYMTRSSKSARQPTQAGSASAAPASESDEDAERVDIETQITQVQKGVKNLKKQLSDLRRQNEELELKLRERDEDAESHVQPKPGRRGSLGNAALKLKVQRLEDKVTKLEKRRAKDSRTIQALEAKELKAEAADLADEDEDKSVAPEDEPYRMRRLLRKFHDLMLTPSLLEDETCVICMDTMVLKKCSSFPCEHTICDGCLPRISKGADETVECPMCRRRCPRDEVMVIHYTASEQWDALLDVAKAWAAMDRRAEDDTSEEEAEEGFIHDDDTTASSGQVEGEQSDSDASDVHDMDDDEEGQDEVPPTGTPPPTNSQISYAQSPTKKKRERLEQLALARKKQRR